MNRPVIGLVGRQPIVSLSASLCVSVGHRQRGGGVCFYLVIHEKVFFFSQNIE